MGRQVDVTVITPTVPGREKLLEECIESVRKQTLQPVAHLVLMDKDKEGPAVIRNRLLKQVETEWVAFLDDDDLLMPNHFDVHNTYMRSEGWDFSNANLDSKMIEHTVAQGPLPLYLP